MSDVKVNYHIVGVSEAHKGFFEAGVDSHDNVVAMVDKYHGERKVSFAPIMIGQVLSNDELIVGESYYCYSKKGEFQSIEKCSRSSSMKWKYLSNKIWADDDNDQALSRWIIVGPIDRPQDPYFMTLGFTYEIGKSYVCNNGDVVEVLSRTDLEGYECLECSDGKYRYDRSTSHTCDGRVTACPEDYEFNFMKEQPCSD